MQGYRAESGLAARAPCPNRGDGGIPTAMIIVIGINLVAVMPGSGYVRFQSGRLNRLYGKCQFSCERSGLAISAYVHAWLWEQHLIDDISVIVPVYNGNRFLAETLHSIARQTLQPREIIVVDDCSTEDTRDCVATALPSAIFLRNAHNGGVCLSRNVGIRASSGSIVALADQDDVWHPEKLARQTAALRGNHDVDFVFTNFTYLRGNTLDAIDKFAQAPARYWHAITEAGDGDVVRLRQPALPKFLEFQPVFPSTVMLRRALLDRAGLFNEALGREQSEDLEFLLRCDSVCRMAAVAASLVTVRKHSGNYSGNTTQTTLSQVRILRGMLAADDRYAPHRALIEAEIVSRSIDVFNGAFAAGDLALSREMLAAIPSARRDAKMQVKAAVTAMPGPVARWLRTALTGK